MEMMEKLARQVIGALIGLARATDGNEHLINPGATAVVAEGLRMTLPGAAGEGELETLLERIDREKRLMVPDCFQCACPCGRTSAYDLSQLQSLPEQERKMKEALLRGAQTLASRIGGAPCTDAEEQVFYKALVLIGMENIRPEVLQSVLQELEALTAAYR